MPAALRIQLTKEEDKSLQELSLADNVPRRVKQRASLPKGGASLTHYD
ncbi:MAG: hypothetical protein KME46_21320 [Brasilonema angustatum HA4187-MV1]|jgi:hypothetical protein|nr:hypothetical protein [Brasilonema angustatum HA4187-MV1]